MKFKRNLGCSTLVGTGLVPAVSTHKENELSKLMNLFQLSKRRAKYIFKPKKFDFFSRKLKRCIQCKHSRIRL